MAEAYRTALGSGIDSEVAPDDWIAARAGLPPIDQPGDAFHYGASTDLLGLIFARREDAPLGRRAAAAPETLALMTTNRLTEAQRAKAEMLGMPLFTAHGFGLGVAVVLDPDKASPIRCRGGIVTVGWPGAFGGGGKPIQTMGR